MINNIQKTALKLCKKCKEPIKLEGKHKYCKPCKIRSNREAALKNYKKHDKKLHKERYEAKIIKKCKKCDIVIPNTHSYCKECRIIARKDSVNKHKKNKCKIKMPRFIFDDSDKWALWDSYR